MLQLYRTMKHGKKPWEQLESLELKTDYDRDCATMVVRTDKKYQSYLGFGGAFTEATAYTLAECDKSIREEIIKAYFHPTEGLGYNMGRLCIHSSDFSHGNYTYIEEGDKELKTFDLSHEDKWLVPLLKEAMEEAGKPLDLMASPWSPPAFMKSNGQMNQGGKLLPEFREAWARYYVKYIQEMEKRGIRIDKITIQNEPEAIQVWDSCEVDGVEEGEFIAEYLAPALKEANLEHIKIVIWDHNKDNVVKRANQTLAVPGVKEAVWGTGYHWYVSDASENLSVLHALYPDKHIVFTEGCIELTNTAMNSKAQGVAGEWAHGEVYGRNIINDFNHYCEGWLDWNLVLNEQGGPNHKNNYCEAPVMVNRNTGEVMYNASYYYIGHFSRHIVPGAKRLLCKHDIETGVYATGFENPNGEIVIVIQNQQQEQKIALVIDGNGVNLDLPEHSIITCVLSK